MAEGRGAVWAGLAASLSALLCCALPSFLVLLGFGTAVASAVSAAPWLTVLSRNKVWVFLLAGLVLVTSRLYAQRVAPRLAREGAACPPPFSRLTHRVWWASVGVYAVGFFVAFLLGPILAWTVGG